MKTGQSHATSRKTLLIELLVLGLSAMLAQCSPPPGLPSPTEGDKTWGLAGKHEHVELLAAIGGSSEDPEWSPDGVQVAFQHTRDRLGKADAYAPRDIYVVNADGTGAQRVTHVVAEQASCEAPSWAPDSRRLVCACNLDGDWDLYTIDTDIGELVRTTDEPGDEMFPVWSPDGTHIAFTSNAGATGDGEKDWAAYVLRLDDATVKRLSPISYATMLAWSPDGRAVVLTPRRDSPSEIPLCEVQIDDGSEACWEDFYCSDRAWSPDGSTIACMAGAEILALNAQTGQFAALLDTEFYALNGLSWSPDSRRLVFAAGLMALAGNDLYVLQVEP